MSVRYPLEQLAALRAGRADGAVLDLGAALAGETGAAAAVQAARAVVAAAVDAARAVVLAPAGEAGAPAWEVARREVWAQRLRREVGRAETRLAQREAELAGWQAAVAQAREQAVSARADHQVVERHRERWEGAEKKKRERRED